MDDSRDPLFLDRIDIQIEIVPLSFEEVSRNRPTQSSKEIRERVVRTRQIQEERYKDDPMVHCNAQMTSAMIRQYATPDADGLAKMKDAMTRFNMSARAYDRILKVARTIADLDASEKVETRHIQEAISYRTLDRGNWVQ